MKTLILGIDAGGHKVKVAGPFGTDSFKSNNSAWFERPVKEEIGESDMEYEIDGQKGFAGTLAEREAEFQSGNHYGDTKAHPHVKVRVLLAIHRYMLKYSIEAKYVKIVTGQPISNNAERQKIVNMLEGPHEYTVNDVKRKITINEVKVSPEGVGAFWSNPSAELTRIIDVGSGTVNAISMLDKKNINKSSGTLGKGMETLLNKSVENMATGVISFTTELGWNRNDRVLVCGGVAEEITPILKQHFPNAEIITPMLKRELDVVQTKPIYANAVGFYNLAKVVYG